MELATVVVKLFIAYLRQAEACERQARIVKSKSKRQGFLDSAGQWARLAAEAERCEALAAEPSDGARSLQRGLAKSIEQQKQLVRSLKRQSFECNKKPQRAL
jgi:hypothetical protein